MQRKQTVHEGKGRVVVVVVRNALHDINLVKAVLKTDCRVESLQQGLIHQQISILRRDLSIS